MVNNGGPAFPISLPGFGDNGASGMTLRDWFAGNEKYPEDLSMEWAEALAGRSHPHKAFGLGPDHKSEIIETVQFWAEAQARYRYIMADAMIEARKRDV